jgi:hypothetical protein
MFYILTVILIGFDVPYVLFDYVCIRKTGRRLTVFDSAA